jgi:hypothetical protein
MPGGWLPGISDNPWILAFRYEIRKLSGSTADFNLDGRVDFKDFAYFANSWLWQKPPE